MARSKRSVHSKKRRRVVLDRAKGHYGNRSRSFKSANESVMHAGNYAFRDRRARKGEFRKLWIQRINAACRANDMSYSRFIAGLKAAEIEVDRKILADLAVTEPTAFAALVSAADGALAKGRGFLRTGLPTVLGAQHHRIVELRRLLGRRSSRSGSVLLEGPRTVGELLDAGQMPTTVLVPESSADDFGVGSVSYRLGSDVEYLVVRDHVFDKLAPSISPQPMLALAPRPQAKLPSALAADAVVLVLIEVGDPGNVGTLIRAAEAFAAVAVVVAGGADPWGAKAVRASAGSIMRVGVISAIEPDDALAAVRAAGATIVGTDAGKGEPHDGGVLAGPVAIVLGSEPTGLDQRFDPLIDRWARIDMPGRTESLNVAMAGTLLLSAARRTS